MTKKGYKQTKEHIQKRIKRGWNHLEETKRKISESHKRLFVEGRLKPSRYWKGKKIFFTDEHKKRISESLRWDNNPSKREEVKKKISLANKGKRNSKRTEFKKGYRFSDEIKIKMLKNSRKALGIKPNKPEKIMMGLIEKNNLSFLGDF